MRHHWKILCVVAAVVLSVHATGGVSAALEQALSLKDLLAEVSANNPELKAVREMARARDARVKVEGGLDDPTLKIEMEDLPRAKPFNNGPGNSMQTRYTISQMIPFPGKRSLKEDIAMKDALGAMAGAKARELEILAMVKEAYYDYALLSGVIKIDQEIQELLSYMARLAEARYGAGQTLQQDVIKVQLEQTMLSNELITLNAEKAVRAERIKTLVYRQDSAGLPDPEPLAPVSSGGADMDAEGLIKRGAMLNPRLKAIEYELQANELAIKAAKKSYYPDFMVGVAPVQRDGRFDSYDLMFQVSIPIWRDRYDLQTKEAVLNAGAMRLRLASERSLKALEVKEAVLNVQASRRISELYETAIIPQAELSFESALKNYQAGKADFLTLLDTGRALKKTRIERLNAIADYRKKLSLLEKAVGVDLIVQDK